MKGLFLEPFDAGSHRAFRRTLVSSLPGDWASLTCPGRHWKWRMRGSAFWFAETYRDELEASPDVLIASSYLPLAELKGLVPSLATVPSILYFHENQLAFPVRREHVGGPDHHFGFTQLVSASAASRAVFNSEFNRTSFFDAADSLLRRMPDCVPAGWLDKIREASLVIPLPLELPHREPAAAERSAFGPLILWNHRWEHDKNPEVFVDALSTLATDGVPFRVAFAGQRFRRAPECFERARQALGDRVVQFGEAPRDEYELLLDRADIVVSTANHEFFGVAIVEAVHAGAMPLVPDRLAYRETVPDIYRYSDDAELTERLRDLCVRYRNGEHLRADRRDVTSRFALPEVLPRYVRLIEGLVASSSRP